MFSGKFNIKVMFLCSIFLKKKRVCPCCSKVTLSSKAVPLFGENVKVEQKLNLGFFAVWVV
jgi:hypothetical protein